MESAQPFISLMICTRNRAASLAQLLDCILQLDVPADLAWEIVLVDNGSSDDTAQVARSYAERLPIRYGLETEPGISFARNRAVALSRGQFLCWLDDDTRPVKGWMKAWLQAFAQHPDGDYFSGFVEPVLEGSPPAWLLESKDLLADLIASRDLGPEPRELSDRPDDFPVGACCAMRGEALRQYKFDTRLGVSPKFRRLGEETAIFRAIRAAGGRGFWVPGAKVRHIIPASRQTLEYVEIYQRSVGETWAALTDIGGIQFMGQPLDRTGRTLLGAPVWLWRLVATNWLRWRMARAAGINRGTIAALQRYGYYRGALDYLVREKVKPAS